MMNGDFPRYTLRVLKQIKEIEAERAKMMQQQQSPQQMMQQHNQAENNMDFEKLERDANKYVKK